MRAVLFDLDGTLLDTADDLGAALNNVLSQYKLPNVPAEIFRPIASDGAKGLLTLGFGEQLAHYDFETLRTQFLNYYENNIAHHTSLYSGVDELITYLDKHNIAWGIVTNKPEYLTLKLLPFFPKFKNCKVVVGGDSLAQRKPHPLPLTYSLNIIKQQAQSCLYVGDAPRDIEAGNAAGMPTVIAGWGYISNLSDCKNWQANFFIQKPEEIINFFEQN